MNKPELLMFEKALRTGHRKQPFYPSYLTLVCGQEFDEDIPGCTLADRSLMFVFEYKKLNLLSFYEYSPS